jgi:hypothetical protein
MDIRLGTVPRSRRRGRRAVLVIVALGGILGAAWHLAPWVLGRSPRFILIDAQSSLLTLSAPEQRLGKIILWRPKLPDYPDAADAPQPAATPFVWAKGWPRISITAVIMSTGGVYARVNGRMATVGETVDGARIESIDLAGVTVSWHGQRRTFQPRRL